MQRKVKYEKTFYNIKTTNKKKLHKTISNITEPSNKINISDKQIPEDVVEVLALSDNFSISVVEEIKLPVTEYIACVESAIKDKPYKIPKLINFN